jgi:signal transduction histidine kinase
MKGLTDLHRSAMAMVDQALAAKRAGSETEARKYFAQALEKEREAAQICKAEAVPEPTFSTIHRSAAYLAYECTNETEALQLAFDALQGSPPPEIAAELESLIEQTNDSVYNDYVAFILEEMALGRDLPGHLRSILHINKGNFLRTQHLASIGVLASSISHDLNTILGPMMMAGRLIEDDPGKLADASLRNLITTSARRGADLVQQILSSARGADHPMAAVDLQELVDEVVKLTRDAIPHISVRSNTVQDLPKVQGNPGQLEQVLLNLLSNARDAMPRGGSVTIEASPILLRERVTPFHPAPLTGSFVALKVTGMGTGIPPEVLPRIFEAFFTTKERVTGLGLATVMGIIRAHGGAVDVESEPGLGSTFTIYLPVPKQAV